MRIPAEAIPPVANLGKEFASNRKAEPVGSPARLANELSAAPQDQALPSAAQEQRGQPKAQGSVDPRQENQAVAVERRQAERRSEIRPVMLDTRSNRGRRRASGDVRINIKV